jgi:prepilin-type N-terminal cleavage/methylation domain-containing protein
MSTEPSLELIEHLRWNKGVDMSSARQIARVSLKQDGFSLIENMIALLILLVMLLGVAASMSSAIQTNRQARRLTAAIYLAQDQIERLRGMDYAALANGNDGPLSEAGQSTGTGLIFNRTWTVTNNTGSPSGAPPSQTKNVAVVVQWTEKDSTSHQVQLQTIMSQP